MDHSKSIQIIAGALAKVGEPLTEGQLMVMAGSVAVLLEKAYQQGQKDLMAITYQHKP